MSPSEEEKENILSQLSDMFAISREQLRTVCNEFSWEVDNCVEYLIQIHEMSNHGAVRKNVHKNASPVKNIPTPSNAFKQKSATNSGNSSSNRNNLLSPEATEILKLICSGYKVIVIMRGAPGSGKSTLAKALLEQCIPRNDRTPLFDFGDFLFCTDNFYYDKRGNYNFDPNLLSEAHAANKRAVQEKAKAGWSPIFVDNTNSQCWEMMPYVEIAVRHGYLVRLLEPATPWRTSVAKLALKNSHGVSHESIRRYLDKYEKTTADDLIRSLANTKYTVPIPQLRLHPPLHRQKYMGIEKDARPSITRFRNENTEGNVGSESLPPKDQRQNTRKRDVLAENKSQNECEFVLPSPLSSYAWTPHEHNLTEFWNDPEKNEIDPSLKISVEPERKQEKKTLLDLLKEGVSEIEQPISKAADERNEQQKPKYERHSVNCCNENPEFARLRQIYPNKEVAPLWDLFEKCDGDINWVVNLLLKEDEEWKNGNADLIGSELEKPDTFACSCGSSGPSIIGSASACLPSEGNSKPQRQRQRSSRPINKLQPTDSNKEFVRQAIQNSFVLSDEHYSPHIRKLRDRGQRNVNVNSNDKSGIDIETQTDFMEDEEQEDCKANEFVEVTLNDNLVKQLKSQFQDEVTFTEFTEQLSTDATINVFLPRTLAKELYMLWLESVYNRVEEIRQQSVRDDEYFARLLKNPKYEHCIESPSNLQEVLDKQLAWSVRCEEEEQQTIRNSENVQKKQPSDLASYLTEMKLCETFPEIPRDTLVDVLTMKGNNYNATVELLCEEPQTIDQDSKLQNVRPGSEQYEDGGYSTHSNDSNYANGERATKMPLSPEEAKRMALRDFEDARNMAAHHCQLKAECYQKAKEAIQKGNSAVAVYYSEIANFHKIKADSYNHRAANFIMDVHKYTQNNPELLDLHYLHVLEALGCLDIFLDRHITGLRAASCCYKHVFIITGRGLHSTGGVSTIKNKVKARLKERNLRWSEVNPGLLKVKIFSASKHSKNV